MTLATTRADFLTDKLREHGYKLTRARRAVIQVLADAAKPLNITDLHERSQNHAADIGLVTVYRTLEVMMQLELVRPVHLMENCHGYAVASPGHTHHVVCSQCNNVVEIEGCDLSTFLDEVQDQTGYRITGHWLELEGLCPDCSARQDST
jgi:Fur family ferric uptake transcriptional regulator